MDRKLLTLLTADRVEWKTDKQRKYEAPQNSIRHNMPNLVQELRDHCSRCWLKEESKETSGVGCDRGKENSWFKERGTEKMPRTVK